MPGETITITGELATGVGQATGFTQLDWARVAFMEKLGIDPYPGTVNLLVRQPAELDSWKKVCRSPATIIRPPRTDWCDAKCYRARIVPKNSSQIDAAIVLPDVEGYADNQIELIAPVAVRDTLKLSDGDAVVIEVDIQEDEK